MYQWPRSNAEDAAFGRAIKVMGDLYASAVGTTVMQRREIPMRPADMDGAGKLTPRLLAHAGHKRHMGLSVRVVVGS